MQKFLSWLKNVHSIGASESAKRLYGAIGFIVAIVYIAIWDHDSIVTLLYVSAGLLGLESIVQVLQRKSKINSKVNEEQSQDEPVGTTSENIPVEIKKEDEKSVPVI